LESGSLTLATKLYFHQATSTVSGTLPSTNQSALTLNLLSDAVTVNRSMNTIKGTTQVSKAIATTGTTVQQNLYYARFISMPLGSQTISANTWDYNFAAQCNNLAANFPVDTSGPVYINCYVWRPSTGAKVGTILEGNSNSDFAEVSISAAEKVCNGTFSGSSLAIQNNDVLCFEMIFRITQATTNARTDTVYYDGTTENTTDNTTVSNHASFINTPQTLSLASNSIDMTVTGGAVTHPKPIQIV